MTALLFTAWAVYIAITAVWLGDNGWTPIVGIPWMVALFGYWTYVLYQDYQNRSGR
jgi:hypothetical protein